jgi:hypothetical protein
MSFAALRESISDNFATQTANVYWWVPEVVMAPAIVLVPDDPYITIQSIRRGTFQVSYRVTCAVSMQDNKAALANLEDLIIGCLGSLPAGFIVGDVSNPTVLNLGQADLLTAEFTISVMEGN